MKKIKLQIPATVTIDKTKGTYSIKYGRVPKIRLSKGVTLSFAFNDCAPVPLPAKARS